MAKYLVIVESPAKVKTIKKFLGANYDVEASNGHVRDFPKSQFGIDVEHDFEPKYITIRGKGELLAKLRKAAKKADKIYLATDPDREGEAISWHLMQALKEDPKKMHRITFNEITKTAVKSSIKQARDLDMDLVDAQQARRMLDRMVGYTISPLLWAKVKRGLSAGRVQSVAVRLVVDRENEIRAFVPQEYWSIDAKFTAPPSRKVFAAKLVKVDGKRVDTPPKELELLPLGAKIITLELAVRFLTDYLDGDRYFRVAYPEHNLVRARAQMKLVADMEAHWDEMQAIVAEEAAKRN